MQKVTCTGRNIDEAIESALMELGALRQEVEVVPLDTGTRGFLGIFGRRDAQVEVGVRDDDVRIPVQVVLRNLLRRLDRDIDITVTPRETEIGVSLGAGAERLPSDRGLTLQALEYLAARIVNQGRDDWLKVAIDAGGRGRPRAVEIEKMATDLAEQALAQGRDQKTDTLSAQDRRLVHLALKDHPKLTTFSVGRGSYRRVVIALREGIPERRVAVSEEDLSRSRYAEGRSAKEADSQERPSRTPARRDQGPRRPRPKSGETSEGSEASREEGSSSGRSSSPPKRSGRRPRRRPDTSPASADDRKRDQEQKTGDPSETPAAENGTSRPSNRRRRRGGRGRSNRGSSDSSSGSSE